MYLAVFGGASFMVLLFLTVLCFGSKKKAKNGNVTSVRFTQHATVVDEIVDAETGQVTSNSTCSTPHNLDGAVDGRSRVQPQSVRSLPQPPASRVKTESLSATASALRHNSTSDGSSIVSGASSNKRNSNSPKGRRLPTPPPIQVEETALHENPPMSQDDEDMYAKVENHLEKTSGDGDGTPSTATTASHSGNDTRLKIHHLDIKEGSGDSSFYAKVGDAVDDSGVYAQVEGDTAGTVVARQQMIWAATDGQGDHHHQSVTSLTPGMLPQSTTSMMITNGRGSEYSSAAEYATIDKVRKGSLHQPSTSSGGGSGEPPAPPIPDRNFDMDDELDTGPVDRDDHDVTTTQSTALGGGSAPTAVVGPTYDKLTVRESLEHLRTRQEAEAERRARYANITSASIAAAALRQAEDVMQAGVYAQIDDDGEAVYESLSAANSADGSVMRSNAPSSTRAADPGYSSVQELPGTSSASAQHHHRATHPMRQHHYEQIVRLPA